MKRTLALNVLLIIVLTLSALPAKRGIWKTITLNDGTKVKAELRGDEYAHWWQTNDGSCYVFDTTKGIYSPKDETTDKAWSKRRVTAVKKRNVQGQTRASSSSIYNGNKKGLIILAEFPDCQFTKATQGIISSVANNIGYRDNGFNGSVHDYFLEQSGGRFNLTFDVAGPVMMSHEFAYYGKDSDTNAGEMIMEACLGVDSSINFADYDWDGDGEAEEVFVLYAGHGQADYDNDNDDLVWPHTYILSETPVGKLTLDNTIIDTYACSSELNGYGDLAGIGAFCHEFSHCLGLPDMYDTSDNPTNYGLGSWDIMAYGSYNDEGYTPAGYSGYEKMASGWANPIKLTAAADIDDVKPLSDNGQSYIVYNKGNNNEYYILDNRQPSGFDANLPGHGLLIEHIDFDRDIWDYNVVNNTTDRYYPNSHPRITIIHANGKDIDDDAAYPYLDNDSLTNISSPAATVFNENEDGSLFMNCVIRNIKENGDGTMSFRFAEETYSPVITDDNDILFKETFDKCVGTGGNDGKFGGTGVAGSVLVPDNDGWLNPTYNDHYCCAGDKCAKFGTTKVQGKVMSPRFALVGDTATLTFKAACWDYKNDKPILTVDVVGNNAHIVEDANNMDMPRGHWTDYTLHIVGKGYIRLLFSPHKRFFLDEVVVRGQAKKNTNDDGKDNDNEKDDDKGNDKGSDDNPDTAIDAIESESTTADSIYTIGGQYVGKDFKALPKGIYIVRGKKVIHD